MAGGTMAEMSSGAALRELQNAQAGMKKARGLLKQVRANPQLAGKIFGAGWESLFNNTSGTGNIAFGFEAGFSLTTGSNNIEIGNLGTSSDSNTIRIGTPGTQTRTFIAGVNGILSGGSESTELVVNRTTGQVGVIPSSARFKLDIHDMGDRSQRLMQLRPVTFRYKHELDPEGIPQFGLVAEDVEK